METIYIEKSRNGWIYINSIYGHMSYLYYSMREAKRLYREKYGIKKAHWDQYFE